MYLVGYSYKKVREFCLYTAIQKKTLLHSVSPNCAPVLIPKTAFCNAGIYFWPGEGLKKTKGIYSLGKCFVRSEQHKINCTCVKVNFSEWVKRVPLVKTSPPVVAPAKEFNSSERSEVERVVLCVSGRLWAAALNCSSIRFCSLILFLER